MSHSLGDIGKVKCNLHGRGNDMLHAINPSAPRMSQTAIFRILHVKHQKGKTFVRVGQILLEKKYYVEH